MTIHPTSHIPSRPPPEIPVVPPSPDIQPAQRPEPEIPQVPEEPGTPAWPPEPDIVPEHSPPETPPPTETSAAEQGARFGA